MSFPSVYFAGTLPHLAYLRLPGGGTLKGPLGDYHDLRILKAFQGGQQQGECLSNLDDFEVDIKAHYGACLEESMRRDALTDIPVMELVQDRIQEHQTFYTFNHCDNAVLWSVAQQTVSKLGVAIDGQAKPPQSKLLGGVIAGIPRSVTEGLGFAWHNDTYIVSGARIPNKDLVAGFYTLYEEIGNFETILNHNRTRFALAVD